MRCGCVNTKWLIVLLALLLQTTLKCSHGVLKGLKIKAAESLELSRGLGRERALENELRVANVTDELPQRAFHRQWKKELCVHRSTASLATNRLG